LFLRLTGGTLTGPLTISANVDGLLVLNRPDGADHAALVAQMAGADVWELEHWAAEPKLRIADTTAAKNITLNTATGAVALVGQLTISANVQPPLIINRPDGDDSRMLDIQLAGAMKYALVALTPEPVMRIVESNGYAILTVRTDNSLLGTSLIPLSMLRREELDGENAGLVTLPTGGFITIVDVTAAANVAVGDRVVCWVDLAGTKGATLGPVLLQLVDQGTANVQWAKDAITAGNRWDVEASAVVQLSWCTVARVTAAGVLTMRLQGGSLGSTMAVAAGGGELRMLILRDSA
jgi:hypothetical protein